MLRASLNRSGKCNHPVHYCYLYCAFIMYPHITILTLYPVDDGIIITNILLKTNSAKQYILFLVFCWFSTSVCDGLGSRLVAVCFVFLLEYNIIIIYCRQVLGLRSTCLFWYQRNHSCIYVWVMRCLMPQSNIGFHPLFTNFKVS